MANGQVGEVELDIGGEKFLLRPSFRALSEIEDRAGMGAMFLAKKISENDIRVKHVVAIIWGGIIGALEAGDKPPVTIDQLGDKIMAAGYNKVVVDAIRFLNSAVRGSDAMEKKSTPEASPPA